MQLKAKALRKTLLSNYKKEKSTDLFVQICTKEQKESREIGSQAYEYSWAFLQRVYYLGREEVKDTSVKVVAAEDAHAIGKTLENTYIFRTQEETSRS